MQLAHIRSGSVVRKYIGSSGRVSLENGDTVSPPVAGYINGNDRIVGVVVVTVDNSTTALTEKTVVEVVEDSRVLRTVTISDVTIEVIRAGMTCTPLQGKLALGEALWGKVMAYRDTASWAEQMVIDDSAVWGRTSQDIQFIGYLVGVTDLEMDDLFRLAVTL